MKAVLLTFLFTLAGIFTSLAQAQVIPLTIDSSQSSVEISIGGSPSRSTLSGNMTLDIQSTSPPSGNVQITELDFVVDESLNFSFLLGAFTASTSPGDITISLVTPGAPGVVSANGFDQLENVFALGGDLNTFQLFVGNDTIDLSTQDIGPTDLSSVIVTQSGDVITVSASFTASETLDLAGGVPLVIRGTYVATGVVPVAEVLLGDVNLDGLVDFADIPAFISVLQSGEFQAEADLDENEMVEFDDIPLFITVLIGQ